LEPLYNGGSIKPTGDTMRQDYSLYKVIFKPTEYRDDRCFKHPNSNRYKNKRWEVRAILRDDDYVEGVSHPEDEFIDLNVNTSFTEWRKKDEDFDPHGFLMKLTESFEALAEKSKCFGNYVAYNKLCAFASVYGNRLDDTVVSWDLIDDLELFQEMYDLPTVNITPFKKAYKAYWDQAYLMYSTCKLMLALFDVKAYDNVMVNLDYFKAKNYEIVIDTGE
jgi:hypothetical protein